MQKGKVNIAQGSPKTLSKLKRFLEDQKEKHPEKTLKTHADAIDFAVEYITELEKRIKELEEEIKKLKGE